MNHPKDFNNSELEALVVAAGLNMETTHIIRNEFKEYFPETTTFVYHVVATEDGDENICICELGVTINRNGNFVADFAGCPLFESNDMSAINDVFKEGATRLGDDFDPLDLKGIPDTEFLSIAPLDIADIFDTTDEES